MVSFIEVENKDFVLKLKINSADGETQIRRVCLPRIADVNGNISYEELVGLVLVFTFPEEGLVTSEESKYTVSLTYYDDDKDLITVASTVELMDAINLFAGQKFMRITTSVKPKKSNSTASSTSTSTAAAASAAASYAQDSSTATGSSTVDRGTFTSDGNDDGNPSPRTPPIQVVLESFAGILSNAVKELKGLATTQVLVPRRTSNNSNDNNSRTEEKPKENTTEAVIPPSASTKSTNIKAKNGDRKKKGLKATKTVVSRGVGNKVMSSKVAIGTLDDKKHVHPGSKDISSEEKKEGSEKETTPFIHGRHTCDCCLITPIVGIRYNNTKDPDYDLCIKCFNNYNGNEIKFEPVQLHRDIPFQARWHRRHQRELMLMKRRDRFSRGGSGGGGHYGSLRGRRFRGLNHGISNCRPGSSNLLNNPKSPPHTVGSPSKENQDVPSSAPLLPPISSDPDDKTMILDRVGALAAINIDPSAEKFGTALKEAIRRSLDDIVPKEASIMKTNKAKEETEEEEVVANDFSGCDAVKSPSPEKDIDDDEKDDIPRSVEISEPDKDEGAICDDLTLVENTSYVLNDQNEVDNMEKAMEKSMDTDSVDSAKLLFGGQESVTNHSSPVVPTATAADRKPPTSGSKSLIFSKDESFSYDAVGNGDVAEVIGKTLDMVAGVISDMLSESHDIAVENKKEMTNESEMGDLKPAAIVENNVETTNESKIGKLIVNSNDDNAIKSGNNYDKDDDSEWSVVKSVCSGGTTESEQIAKAAEMLGSALFNSDIKTLSEENGSNLIGSDSSSSISSSVPIDIDTQYSRATESNQPTRWANELEKLTELGFKNEASCIAVLKKLESSDDVGIESTGSIPTNIDRSVPTDIGTQHSKGTESNQPTRWAKELEKLRELGFKIEASCIAVLDRLESSADLGTESTGSIATNIDRVIDELLELNE